MYPLAFRPNEPAVQKVRIFLLHFLKIAVSLLYILLELPVLERSSDVNAGKVAGVASYITFMIGSNPRFQLVDLVLELIPDSGLIKPGFDDTEKP